MVAILFFIFPILIILAILFIISFYFTFILLPIKKFSTEFTILDGLKKSEFSENELNQDKVEFSFKSRFGYKLKGQIYIRDINKIVIFSHGVTWTLYGMYKYMIPFISKNYTCVLLDSKGHGESSGGFPTFGYYEKYDLYDCYCFIKDFVNKNYYEKDTDKDIEKDIEENVFEDKKNTNIGLFGESMGAAITLQALNLFKDNEISFCIVDSPFSDLEKLCLFQLEKSLKLKFLVKIIFEISRLLIFILARFDLKKIKPIEIDDNVNVPILLFHGEDDKLVPYYMSKQICEKRKGKALTEFYLIKGADHTKGFMMEKDFYINKMFEFIEKIYNKN